MSISSITNQGRWYDSSSFFSKATNYKIDSEDNTGLTGNLASTNATNTRTNKNSFEQSLQALMMSYGYGAGTGTNGTSSTETNEPTEAVSAVNERTVPAGETSVDDLLSQLEEVLEKRFSSDGTDEVSDDDIDDLISQLKDKIGDMPPPPPPPAGGDFMKMQMQGISSDENTETDTVTGVSGSNEGNKEASLVDLLKQLEEVIEANNSAGNTKGSDDELEDLLSQIKDKIGEMTPPMGGNFGPNKMQGVSSANESSTDSISEDESDSTSITKASLTGEISTYPDFKEKMINSYLDSLNKTYAFDAPNLLKNLTA